MYGRDAAFLLDLPGGTPEAVDRIRACESRRERVGVPLPSYIEWLR